MGCFLADYLEHKKKCKTLLNIAIYLSNHEFHIQFRMYFPPKSERNNLLFK